MICSRDIDLPKYNGKRCSSINECFLTLGADYDDIYAGPRRGWKCLGTIYDRYEIHELLLMASKLHRKAAKRYHPDLHKTGKLFHNRRFQEINAAYQRIKGILKYREG